MPFGLTAAASAADAKIHKKILGSGPSGSETITLVISSEEMQDVIKIVKYLKDSEELHKGATKTVENEIKEQRHGFLIMFLDTLGANLLENLFSSKGVVRD